MSLLSPAELASIQSVAQSGMVSTATILTRETIETADGQESVWATGADIPCWVHQERLLTGEFRSVAGAVAVGEDFSIRVPIGSGVVSGDQLAVGSTMYMVQKTNASDTYPAWVNCSCRLVE